MGANRLDTVLDAVVIGAGPAGVTVAGLLASWGRSVVMIHRETDQPSLAESLPSSTRKILRFLGQLEAIDAGDFHPNYGNISRWAGKEVVAATAESGYHVSRERFDRLLREHARSKGVTILNGYVQRVDVADTVTIDCAVPAGVAGYRARFVLDCSGRAGVVARHGLRRADTGYRTLAVAAEWECEAWPDGERHQTFVESYQEGWAWSVPLSATRRQCTVMLDADRTIIRKAGLESLYRDELRKAPGIRDRLARCRQLGRPWACDASLYDCTQAVESTAVLVGDAASFIEPLSSAGVKKALTSAWRSAVVVNTCLSRPGMLAAASDFHNRRERDVYRECLRRSAAFFSDAAAVHDDTFWSSRVRGCSVAGGSPTAETAEIDPELDPAVRVMFERLRETPTFGLKPAPSLRFDQTAVIEDREIVLRDAVLIPGLDEPVRFWSGVNLPELIRISAGCHDVASLIETYHHRVASIDPRSLVAGLSFLIARGLMIRSDAHNIRWDAQP